MGKLIPKPITDKTAKVTFRQGNKVVIVYGKDQSDALARLGKALDTGVKS